MRIALVSPYSWNYQGGVNRHVEELSEELLTRGHHVRILAPWDPDDRLSRRLHRSAPKECSQPDHLIPLGRTVGIGSNGAVSNLSYCPGELGRMRRELRAGRFDVVHVHEPTAALIGWDAATFRGAPVVGTFHAYATRPMPHRIANLLGAQRIFNQLSARVAVSEAAAWTCKRWFGGDYTVIPNGVDLASAPSAPRSPADHLRLIFVGRAEERKGLPVLLAAFGALIEHVPARLTVVGADPAEVRRMISDPEVAAQVDAVGPVGDEQLWSRLGEADVLCAPSVAGESFGMVLIEAMAAGTPVLASDIAGYRELVSNGVDGILVPAADPQRLAEELQELWHLPERRTALGEAGRATAQRYGWPRVADRLTEVYERAKQAAPAPTSPLQAGARRLGFVPLNGEPARRAERLPSLEPAPARSRARTARRIGVGLAALIGVGLTFLAAQRIGLDNVGQTIIRSQVTWVLLACGLMVASLFLRAVSWVAIARSALPGRTIRRRDVASATMIGVLMSATLPARLGEPARAMVLARRVGRMRETFSVLVGTLVSQTVLNIIALALLGAIIVGTTDLFHSSTERLFLVSLAPLGVLVAVLFAPIFVRANGKGRISRVAATIREALREVRQGLHVFRDPGRGAIAVSAQLFAWGLQLLACWALFAALGLDHRVGIGAAAAVLFAVNVTAVIPATPSNIGVFQLAVITVLSGGFGISHANALAYGVILQAVEIATAVALGVPALVREGVTWSDMRLRALQAAPVRLEPRSGRRERDRVPLR